jgi:hypothetical protein
MRSSLHSRFLPALLGAALSVVAPACYGTVGAGYVDVAYAPANYSAYPSYYYDGANVYYVDGRWYRYDHGHWGYYRSEPRELYYHRSRVYEAPRASSGYRGGDHRHYNTYIAPPARREVYRAPPQDNRHYSAPPRRDDRHYRAPSRDDHHHHGRD